LGHAHRPQIVRIGASDDEETGMVDGSEVVTGTTDSDGQFAATFTAGTVPGAVTARAELLVPDSEGYRTVGEATQDIVVGVGGENKMYLPVLQWG
jgi:hypothetical protein